MIKKCSCGFEKVVKKEVWTKCPNCGSKTDWEFIKEDYVKIEGEQVVIGASKDGKYKLMTKDGDKYNIYVVNLDKVQGMKLGTVTNRLVAETIINKL